MSELSQVSPAAIVEKIYDKFSTGRERTVIINLSEKPQLVDLIKTALGTISESEIQQFMMGQIREAAKKNANHCVHCASIAAYIDEMETQLG
jgi:predicted CopG family antitoxin